MAAGHDEVGTLLRHRYRLREPIGRGAMGEVWLALDESLGRRVAVKCLKPLSPAMDEAFTQVLRERFRREARVAASLQHRGVTVVHDFGEDDGVLFLVMEMLDGRNLSQALADNQSRPLPVPDVADIAEQLAVALAHTHAQGVVHRDLKPANIIRLSDGSVKICDFGIARLGHDIGFTSRLTGTGIAIGTPHYMSPEQIGAGEVDHRSDLYSLGCVLYELATGVPPFDLGDTWSVLVGHRDTPPDPPRLRRPELPHDLERLVLDLLAKDPEDRPQNAADVAGRLKEIRVAGTRPAGLPGWARGLTMGSGARLTRTEPASALTGVWSTRPAPALPAGRTARQEAAYALGQLGRWAEALALHEESAAEFAARLGAEHPHTLAARHETGIALGRMGRSAEARELYEELVAVRTRTAGPADPGTLRARHGLGVNLGRLGRWEEALAEARDVAAIRERVLGPDHPDTLVSKRETAVGLGWLGRWSTALTAYREVADARERALGPTHPDTLTSRDDEAHCLEQLGRPAEALALHRRVEALRQEGPQAL